MPVEARGDARWVRMAGSEPPRFSSLLQVARLARWGGANRTLFTAGEPRPCVQPAPGRSRATSARLRVTVKCPRLVITVQQQQ